MTAEEQDEIADLRAQLAGLRMMLHARKLRARASGSAGRAATDELMQPVMTEIAEVKLRLRSLGEGFS